MLFRDELVLIPQVYSGRRFGWLGPVVFTPIWGFFHVKFGVLLLLRVWLQLVATAVASALPQLVMLVVCAVVISYSS